MIPYGKQSIDEDDIHAVTEVLRSDWLTQGPVVPKFECMVKDFVGASHAIAATNATSALHLACLALGVGPGDIVWTSAITFVASANCALYCGASVDFIDINSATYNIDISSLEEKLSIAKKEGKLPKVVIPVHLCGQSCEMDKIFELSKQYHFKIIEDASHAIGGMYKSQLIGGCQYSDVTVFSFHPVKIITTGEGGMAITNSPELAASMRLLRGHGITTATSDFAVRPSEEVWNYQQISLGFNYRMTEMQAALGISQLGKLDKFVERRQEIAEIYNTRLSNMPITLPWQHPDTRSCFHLYPIRLKLNELGISGQKEFIAQMHSAGVGVNLHYIPVYRHPFYESLGFKRNYCKNAEEYFKSAVTLPLFPGLANEAQLEVMELIRKFFQ
jgi:UDP-4-amino-4,6-dideoxy-N-acetyl-beta-L-altrosamine transaminase